MRGWVTISLPVTTGTSKFHSTWQALMDEGFPDNDEDFFAVSTNAVANVQYEEAAHLMPRLAPRITD